MPVPLHRKNDSGELGVFEAARYFSGANENNTRLESVAISSRAFESRPRPGSNSASRLSLDTPINIALDTKRSKENNKKSHKQPSSPGGKLIATLINSIFNQSASKKKKKKSSKSSPVENRETGQISPGEISSRNRDSKKTAKTPTKSSYRELLFRKFPVSRPGNRDVPGSAGLQHDEKSRFGNRNFGLSGRNNNPKARVWFDDNDDDGESDSSSDLFDLPMISNEINFFSRGLPAYGTTHMERMRVVL